MSIKLLLFLLLHLAYFTKIVSDMTIYRHRAY